MGTFIKDNGKYFRITYGQAYCEMNDEDLNYCIETETNYYLPKIETMRSNGYSEEYIAYCLHDLYSDYDIYDDYIIAKKANLPTDILVNISDIYWNFQGMNNPLKF